MKKGKYCKLLMVMFCGLLSLLLLIMPYVFATDNSQMEQKYYDGETAEIYVPEDSIFVDDSEVLYYAYMDLSTADDPAKSKILQRARWELRIENWGLGIEDSQGS